MTRKEWLQLHDDFHALAKTLPGRPFCDDLCGDIGAELLMMAFAPGDRLIRARLETNVASLRRLFRLP